MPNPYVKADGSAQLKESFVLYLDVLGSKQWAQDLDDVELEEMRQTLAGRRWFLHDQDHDEARQRLHSFTDNLVLGVPHDRSYGDAGLLFVVSSCVYYQLNLAARGRLLRGGLTSGPHFMDEQLVAGPALVEAVDLEQVATFPRVLLSDDVVELARQAFSEDATYPLSHYLLVDEDDRCFVNYLPGVADDGIPGWDIEGLMEHKRQIEGRLKDPSIDDRTRAKYVWAAQYHNFVCRRAIDDPSSLEATRPLSFDEIGTRVVRAKRNFRPVPGLS
jgi:hypothetical protein